MEKDFAIISFSEEELKFYTEHILKHATEYIGHINLDELIEETITKTAETFNWQQD